ERDGGYRTWKKDRWPDGPQGWLDACAEHGLLPGLWFPANTAFELDPPAAWGRSLASDGWGLSCFEGGFLEGFVEVLEHWYAQGIRVFKFDFADFGAATEPTRLKMLPSEIRSRNVTAYRQALAGFRARCPEAILLAYNGFEEAEFMTWTDRPVRRVIDPKWLEVFDTIYCGDPRPADVPLPDFWRTLDVYADHMVRFLHEGGLPLDRIDDCASMFGVAGTCYRRGSAGWRASLLLSLARGGRVHMTLGNLELLSEDDARFFAQAQDLFRGVPRICQPAGWNGVYGWEREHTTILVNPSLSRITCKLPRAGLSLGFLDGWGDLADQSIDLGPGAVALLTNRPGLKLEAPANDRLPPNLEEVEADWSVEGRSARATFVAPGGDLHFLFEQRDAKGLAVRTPIPDAGANWLGIEVAADGRPITVDRQDDRPIWSGMSWAYGVVRRLPRGSQVEVRMRSVDTSVATILPAVRKG
ncbi:MAG TPA: hypothetical protein VMI31_05535, partial [Fimbriimonadaceae bacterium]|nr:hypothetical protein [Fimbriimonadaceae bacterium]